MDYLETLDYVAEHLEGDESYELAGLLRDVIDELRGK